MNIKNSCLVLLFILFSTPSALGSSYQCTQQIDCTYTDLPSPNSVTGFSFPGGCNKPLGTEIISYDGVSGYIGDGDEPSCPDMVIASDRKSAQAIYPPYDDEPEGPGEVQGACIYKFTIGIPSAVAGEFLLNGLASSTHTHTGCGPLTYTKQYESCSTPGGSKLDISLSSLTGTPFTATLQNPQNGFDLNQYLIAQGQALDNGRVLTLTLTTYDQNNQVVSVITKTVTYQGGTDFSINQSTNAVLNTNSCNLNFSYTSCYTTPLSDTALQIDVTHANQQVSTYKLVYPSQNLDLIQYLITKGEVITSGLKLTLQYQTYHQGKLLSAVTKTVNYNPSFSTLVNDNNNPTLTASVCGAEFEFTKCSGTSPWKTSLDINLKKPNGTSSTFKIQDPKSGMDLIQYLTSQGQAVSAGSTIYIDFKMTSQGQVVNDSQKAISITASAFSLTQVGEPDQNGITTAGQCSLGFTYPTCDASIVSSILDLTITQPNHTLSNYSIKNPSQSLDLISYLANAHQDIYNGTILDIAYSVFDNQNHLQGTETHRIKFNHDYTAQPNIGFNDDWTKQIYSAHYRNPGILASNENWSNFYLTWDLQFTDDQGNNIDLHDLKLSSFDLPSYLQSQGYTLHNQKDITVTLSTNNVCKNYSSSASVTKHIEYQGPGLKDAAATLPNTSCDSGTTLSAPVTMNPFEYKHVTSYSVTVKNLDTGLFTPDGYGPNPGAPSTINLPMLPPGNYQVTLVLNLDPNAFDTPTDVIHFSFSIAKPIIPDWSIISSPSFTDVPVSIQLIDSVKIPFSFAIQDSAGTEITQNTNSISHVWKNPGHYSVKLNLNGPNGCENSDTKEVVIETRPLTFTIFPVPTDGRIVSVQYQEKDNPQSMNLALYDDIGRLLSVQNFSWNPAGIYRIRSTEELPPATYLVRAVYGKKIMTGKFIIQ